MSTILDALRKLEEERHSRTADARSRLLLSPAHQARPLQLRRSAWKAKRSLLSVMGLIVAGFSAGAGFVFWRSYSDQTGSAAPRVVASASSLPDARPNSPSAPPQSASETFPLEQESDSPPLTGTTPSLPLPPAASEEQNSDLTSISAVQRSPFAATSPAPREATPTQQDTTAVANRTPAPTPSAVYDLKQQDSPYEVLLPSGAIRTMQSPTPPATNATTPPTNAPAPPTSSGTALSFLQWSSDPEKRIAFLRVNGGPLTMAHEGDTIGGYTVVEIRQNAVELQSGETRLTLRPH